MIGILNEVCDVCICFYYLFIGRVLIEDDVLLLEVNILLVEIFYNVFV